MAGGLSDTVAVWMLFNPKKKRFGFQGAIPKNQARLAKSLGRTVGERLLTPGDLQSELARPELLAAFQSRVEDVIAAMLTSRDPLIDKVPPAVVTALEGATTAYLPVAMTKLGTFLGQLRSDVIAAMLTSRDPLIDKVPPAVVTALEGATTAYLPVAMTKLGTFLGQPTT